ncbi:MAG: hypothetical protein LQ342_004280 [Letrouitia transgressa]|nr:MAG: hypothetical protein LQ342_004280 [Letrouitia transgressa]
MPAPAPSNESDTPSPPSVPLGRLVFPDYDPTDLSGAWMKCVHLYVGRHQRMTGEVKKLPNPMAVLRRVVGNAADNENEELEIAEIIYYKSALFIGVKYLVTALYNIYFHPLAKYPGPRFAAASILPYVRKLVDGHMADWLLNLHSTYGDIIRIKPDELSYIGPGAWQEIYASRPQLPKSTIGLIPAHDGVPNLINQTNDAEHARQRRILGQAFSDRALKGQEDILKYYTDLLITKLKAEIKNSGEPSIVVDIARWFNFTTFDTVGDLLFNDPFHSLEDAADHPWVEAVMRSVKFGTLLSAFNYFPPMPSIVQWLMPKSVRRYGRMNYEWCQNKITKRIQSEVKRPDFMSFILESNTGRDRMSRKEIDANGSILILAGSETSATTSTSSSYYMLKNPRVYQRLRKEVRQAFNSFDEITVSAAAQLPYLRAVISEALRLHPTNPTSVPRVVDRPDVVLGGHSIPMGRLQTRVGIAVKPMNRSPRNYVDSDVYAPERWLEGKNAKYERDRKELFEPFMVGPRNCVGKPLAWAEMNLILCKVLWSFDIELDDSEKDDDWSMKQRVWIMHERTPLLVRITPRTEF